LLVRAKISSCLNWGYLRCSLRAFIEEEGWAGGGEAATSSRADNSILWVTCYGAEAWQRGTNKLGSGLGWVLCKARLIPKKAKKRLRKASSLAGWSGVDHRHSRWLAQPRAAVLRHPKANPTPQIPQGLDPFNKASDGGGIQSCHSGGSTDNISLRSRNIFNRYMCYLRPISQALVKYTTIAMSKTYTQ
jgi:hypothetical protein